MGAPSAARERQSGGDDRFERRERRFSATHGGFDVHCAVRLSADDDAGRERTQLEAPSPVTQPPPAHDARPAPSPAPAAAASSAAAAVDPRVQNDPTTLTVEHWRRLLDGALLATASPLDWAVLLRRTYGVEIYWP